MAAPMMIAAAVMQAVGQISQGEAAGRAENRQGDLALQNATASRQQANADEERQRRMNALRMGEARAGAAESGFDSSSGSLAGLLVKNAGEMELDALTTRYKGQMEAISFENEAATHRANAKSARRSGYMNAFGSLMQAGASYGGGFGAKGPGFSGQQPGAPVVNRG
jgi:hypothetical protein